MQTFYTGAFIVFFTVVFVVYYAVRKGQWSWLLLSSVLFYMWINPVAIVVPLLVIAITYRAGIAIGKTTSEIRQKRLLTVGVSLNLLILLFFKYIGFLISSLVSVSGWLFPGTSLRPFDGSMASLWVPLGISYVTFQSIGYLIEVRRGNMNAERTISHLAGYLLFFPKIIAGPVERAQHFLPQIKKRIPFDYARISSGITQFGWGLFKKLVIADRLGIFVNSVYGNVYSHEGYPLLIVFVLFPIQIYADFSGYTDMALGISKTLGYELGINFNRPFAAKSMVEFWRRWHISLSTWFNEYFYLPLVIRKRDWGKWSMVYGSMLTFLLLGLWHGPNWTYVVFGGINGCYIAVEFFTTRSRKKLRGIIPPAINTWGGMLYVFLAFGFASVFFRAGTVADGVYMVSHLFTGNAGWPALRSALQDNGLNITDYVIALLLIPFMFWGEKQNLVVTVRTAPTWIRWSVYYIFLAIIVVYGISSGTGFIYKQF